MAKITKARETARQKASVERNRKESDRHMAIAIGGFALVCVLMFGLRAIFG